MKRGKRSLVSSVILLAEQKRMIEPLERLTPAEAKWLHRNRTLDFVHTLIIAKNEVQLNPLTGDRRIAWNEAVREWRASDGYPFKEK